MKYFKLYEKYTKAILDTKEFFQWLSMKFGQPVGNYLGSGMLGMIYCFGKDCKRAIKITSKPDKDYASIKDKNIKGVVKVFSNGKIKVPTKFIQDGFGGSKYVDFGNGLMRVEDGFVYYTIMEYIKTDQDLTHSIEDLTTAIRKFISNDPEYKFDNYKGEEVPMLRMLFLECENMKLLQDLYDFTYEYYNEYYDAKIANDTVSVMTELSVLFKNMKSHIDWMDIHADQFGYNSKGEITAYDIDNPVYLAPEDSNVTIKENEEDYSGDDKLSQLRKSISKTHIDDLTSETVASYIETRGNDSFTEESDEEMLDRIWTHMNSIKKLTEPMTLYRILALNNIEELKRDNIGQHFILDKSRIDDIFLYDIGMELEENIDKQKFLLTLKVSKKDIDLIAMLDTNMDYKHEYEITVKEFSNIEIENIEKYKE